MLYHEFQAYNTAVFDENITRHKYRPNSNNTKGNGVVDR